MGVLAAIGVARGARLGVKVAVLAVTVVVAYLAVTAVQVWLTSRRSAPAPAQAIVVMGAAQYDGVPSPDLEARLRQALSLYERRLAPVVVATGWKMPGDRYTESQASALWLEAHGVPADAVVEVGGADSWANLADAAAALRARGADHVLVVTDGFHEDRSLAIATDVGLRASPVPATGSPITGWSTVPYFAKETLGVAVGRVVGYAHLHSLGAKAAPLRLP
jgi:uncharacterized SAM-binding protein YcdF (DUF218 family)